MHSYIIINSIMYSKPLKFYVMSSKFTTRFWIYMGQRSRLRAARGLEVRGHVNKSEGNMSHVNRALVTKPVNSPVGQG